MILAPGIYPDMPMADYLAIDALSSTPARTIIEECPRAAWWRSRLNPEREREESERMDIGTIAHSLLLEGDRSKIAVIDPADFPAKTTGAIPEGWTNASIRAARDNARASGLQPVLVADMVEIDSMVTVAHEFVGSLRTTEPAIWRAFQPDGGRSEVTIVWDDGGTLCKLRIDRAALDYGVAIDYKTSAMSVEPDRFGRAALSGMGYGFSAAWYCRGIKAATGAECDYVFLAQEVEAPYLCSLPGCDPARMALEKAKVATALRMWQECVRTGQWDGYPNRVCYPELPAWESAKFAEKFEAHGIPFDYAALTGRDKPEFLK
jgi:hypothetical protein